MGENSFSGDPVERNAGDCSPGGANQLSPALQRWGEVEGVIQVPEGRPGSSSMPDAQSIFTLCIRPGIIMRPVLAKKRDTSLPWSARRATASAGIAFRGLRVLITVEPAFQARLVSASMVCLKMLFTRV